MKTLNSNHIDHNNHSMNNPIQSQTPNPQISTSINRYQTTQESDTKKPMSLVICFGEMLFDSFPSLPSVSCISPDFKNGSPANVAVCISNIGGSSALICKVENDQLGFMLADVLTKNKVNSSISVQESQLDLNLVKQAKIFHFDSSSLINEPCKSTLLAAIDIAKKSGGILSYDVNLKLSLWSSREAAREGIMGVWNQVDVIKVNEDEIKFLTNGVRESYVDNVVMKKLFHPNLKLLLVTQGGKDCRYYTKRFKGMVHGVKVECIDSAGAADAFVGGILSVLAIDKNLYKDEKRLRKALRFANACGGLVATKKGAIAVMPTREEVNRILEQQSNNTESMLLLVVFILLVFIIFFQGDVPSSDHF